MGNELKFKASLDDNVSGKLGKIRTEFDRLGGKGSAASLFGNVGAKAVAVGFGLIASAASGAADFLGSALEEAMQAEAGMAALTASLKANVPGWNGVTASIEKTIDAQTRLGFKDDEARSAMTLLVAATHDVDEAFRVLSVAEDLARFKGISLQEAAEALTKVEGGSYRILKSLGIQLEKGATQQEALTAVEKVAQGQAEAYANTLSGKMARANATIAQGMEHLGGFLLPIVATAVENLSNLFSAISGDPAYQMTGALKMIADAVGVVSKAIAGMIKWINDALGAIGQLIGGINALLGGIGDVGTNIGRLPGGAADALRNIAPHADGGWVGLNGPEIGLLGEKGPEYVIPHNQLGRAASSGFEAVAISKRDLAKAMDQEMYFMLRRAAPAAGRI